MNFNFIGFILFLLIVFTLYWSYFNRSARLQNLLMAAASLFFYGWMDCRFLWLLLLTVFFNFYTAKGIARFRGTGSLYLLCLGLIGNIGLLVYFKYFNFFRESFIHFFGLKATHAPYNSLNIILPLGISFFTFQAMGYLIDIYNKEVKPGMRLLNFVVFITWFPKITAGPIERAERFLAQTETRRIFDYSQAADGLRQILWGLFTKLVIADNCGSIVDPIFDNYLHLPSATLLAGAFFYTFQLYCDFSGYSNIAIGVSRLFGIQLTRNFKTPFLASNIPDFWRRWHISLSTWMMNYVFSPLSFSLRRYRRAGLIVAIMTTFLVIGLWHGANWTFVAFGALHGLYFIPGIIAGPTNKPPLPGNTHTLPSLKQSFKIFRLFLLVMLTMIIFRADSVSQAIHYIGRIFTPSAFSRLSIPESNGISKSLILFLLILLLMALEWVQRNKEHELQIDHIKSAALRIGIYYTILLAIFLFGSVSHMNFIYSQY